MTDAVTRAYSSLEEVSSKSERGGSILAQQFLYHKPTKGELEVFAALEERSLQIIFMANFSVHKYGVEDLFATVDTFTDGIETALIIATLLRKEGLARSS